MEITDFCFLGHAVLGPRIISKIEQKGVINNTHKNGDNISQVYYVQKDIKKNIYYVECSGKDSSIGKHILSTRTNITVDEFQKFLQDLSGVFLPQEPEKRKRQVMPEEKVQKIVDMVKVGYSTREIADKLKIDVKVLQNKLAYLRHQGVIPYAMNRKNVKPMNAPTDIPEETKKEPQEQIQEPTPDVTKEVVNTAQALGLTSTAVEIERWKKVEMACKLAAAMLVMGVEFTDEQLAKRSVGITNEILKLV